jgi:hypothetical protein
MNPAVAQNNKAKQEREKALNSTVVPEIIKTQIKPAYDGFTYGLDHALNNGCLTEARWRRTVIKGDEPGTDRIEDSLLEFNILYEWHSGNGLKSSYTELSKLGHNILQNLRKAREAHGIKDIPPIGLDFAEKGGFWGSTNRVLPVLINYLTGYIVSGCHQLKLASPVFLSPAQVRGQMKVKKGSNKLDVLGMFLARLKIEGISGSLDFKDSLLLSYLVSLDQEL